MGIFYGLTGITTLIASLSAGLLWDRYGAIPVLMLGATWSILAIGTLASVYKHSHVVHIQIIEDEPTV